jgi:hypothetical protein
LVSYDEVVDGIPTEDFRIYSESGEELRPSATSKGGLCSIGQNFCPGRQVGSSSILVCDGYTAVGTVAACGKSRELGPHLTRREKSVCRSPHGGNPTPFQGCTGRRFQHVFQEGKNESRLEVEIRPEPSISYTAAPQKLSSTPALEP